MTDLFDSAAQKRRDGYKPLADRLRPTTLDGVLGQDHLIGPDKSLRLLIERDEVPSMIFWGPPGSGKTTLAKVIALMTKSKFVELSAVMSGVADIRQAVKNAEADEKYQRIRTILFIDEIHRFNKGQQDALLPYVENGTVTLIGATTENPSFEVNSALLSRTKVFVLNKVSLEDVVRVLKTALSDKEKGLSGRFEAEEGVIESLAAMADGDVRHALNALEFASKAAPIVKGKSKITIELVKDALQRTHLLYDKGGEEHYNIISALHKSLRGSDPDAGLYWMGRMLEAGEDPLYVARRLVRFASEDIGMADPNALVQAVAAYQAAHFLGMPECNVHLAQAAVYLALAPKSNALYEAYSEVRGDIQALPNEPVPLHIRNAPTKLMKNLGYGKGYIYNPAVEGPVNQEYLPEKLKGKKYWKPKSRNT
ncbi:replication-associated recombination protein A [Patescibacteria group bacterium]|jgi:putative ATPase|nr:replication-associated recombination protein A [Patescibacteria group bacterium]